MSITYNKEGSLYRVICREDETINAGGFTCVIKKGESGGLVENLDNITPYGGAWVEKGARIMGNATLESGFVGGSCIVSGNARVINSCITGNARINGDSSIVESFVAGEAKIGEDARVAFSQIEGNAIINGDAVISGSRIFGSAQIGTGAIIKDGAQVCCGIIVSAQIAGTKNIKLCPPSWQGKKPKWIKE